MTQSACILRLFDYLCQCLFYEIAFATRPLKADSIATDFTNVHLDPRRYERITGLSTKSCNTFCTSVLSLSSFEYKKRGIGSTLLAKYFQLLKICKICTSSVFSFVNAVRQVLAVVMDINLIINSYVMFSNVERYILI